MKIRRIVSAAAAAAFLLQIPALANGSVRAVVDYERSRVTVSGTAENSQSAVIEVIKPSVEVDLGSGTENYTIAYDADFDALPEAVQKLMLDWFGTEQIADNSYSVSYDALGAPGVYTVVVKVSDGEEPVRTRFYFGTAENSAADLAVINGYISAKDKANVRKFITDNKDKYFITAELYDDAAMGDAVASGIIAEGTASKMSVLTANVEKYSVMQALKTGDTVKILLDNAQLLELTSLDEYAYLKNGSSDFQKELGDRIKSASFDSYADFIKEFKGAMCLTGVHYAENYGEISGILNRAKAAGYLSGSPYFNLSSTKSVDEKLISNYYSDMDALKTAIEGFCKNSGGNTTDGNKPSGGGSGGGGGTGGGKGSSVNASASSDVINQNAQDSVAFSDVDESHWAYLSILSLKKMGAINGYSDGTFKPDNSITRREFVKIALSAFGISDANAKSTFKDVPESDWGYASIAAAQEHGIISGDENGNFNGDSNITRQDVAKILYGVLKFKSQTLPAQREYTGFNDYADIADYAAEGVEALYRGGAVNGFEDGTFKPKDFATRAETAKMIFSVLQKIGG